MIDDSNNEKDNESLASYISIPLGFVGAVSIIALLIIHGMKGINKFLLIANQIDIFNSRLNLKKLLILHNFLGRNSKGDIRGAELIGLHVKRKSSVDNKKLLLDEIRPLHIKHILEDKIKPEKEEYVQLNELDRKKNVSQYSTAFGNMFGKFNRCVQILEVVSSSYIISVSHWI